MSDERKECLAEEGDEGSKGVGELGEQLEWREDRMNTSLTIRNTVVWHSAHLKEEEEKKNERRYLRLRDIKSCVLTAICAPFSFPKSKKSLHGKHSHSSTRLAIRDF